MRRFSRSLFLLLVAVVLVIGCRAGVRPEAGLKPSYFAAEAYPVVAADSRGFHYLVVGAGTALKPLVVLEFDGQRKLFYAIARGERTAQLLPISSGVTPMLEGATDKRVVATFVDDPSTLQLDEQIAWYSSNKVVWLGPPPQGDTAVVAVASQIAPDSEAKLSEWMLGAGRVAGDKVVDIQVSDVFLLGDGAAAAVELRGLTMASVKAPVVNGYTFTTRDENVRWEDVGLFWLQPYGRRHSADVVVGKFDSDLFVFSTNAVTRNGVVLGVSESPLVTPIDGDGVITTLQGLRHVLSGNLLSGAMKLTGAGPKSLDNPYGGQLRAAELVGAAGRPYWTRWAMLRGADGIDADDAMYLARAYALAGEREVATTYAQKAKTLFYRWTSPASELGVARADQLLATLSAQSGEHEAAMEASLLAAQGYDDGSDSMRAARAEFDAAGFALASGKSAEAEKAAMLARSRFYHGNSVYYSGLAEMRLADVYRSAGNAKTAEEMATYAIKRFESLGDPAAANWARVTRARVTALRSTSGAKKELQLALEKALSLRDAIGAFDAATSMVEVGVVPGGAEKARVGGAIARSLHAVGDPYLRARGERAIARLCSEGLVELAASLPRTDSLAVGAACNTSTDGGLDASMATMVLNKGYTALAQGDLVAAEAASAELSAMLSEDMRMNDPRQAAEIVLFGAVMRRAKEPGKERTQVVEGIELVRRSIDPTRAAQTFSDLSNRFADRNQVWLADTLLEAAIESAGGQSQFELQRDLVLSRVALLHADASWDEVLDAVRTGEPILERAGTSAPPLLGRLNLYRTDVLTRLERTADASRARERAEESIKQLDGAGQLDLAILELRFALGRGSAADANRLIQKAKGLESGLPASLAQDPRRPRWKAELEVLKGRVAGTSVARYSFATSALEMTRGDELIDLRVEALAVAGENATGPNESAKVAKDLDAIIANQELDPKVHVAAGHALARLHLLEGAPSNAVDVLRRIPGATGGANGRCLMAQSQLLTGSTKVTATLGSCAKRKGPGAREAELLLALRDEESFDGKGQLARRWIRSLGPDLSGRERSRLNLLDKLTTVKTKPNAKKDGTFKKKVDSAADNTKKIKAVTDYAEYLIDSGRGAEAAALVDANSGVFYGGPPEAAGELVRLRIRALFHQLRVYENLNYAYRAVLETPDLAPGTEAEISLLIAQNDAVLGLWHHCRASAQDALDAAKTAKNRKLEKRIRTFATDFGFPLKD